jgi:hypothetical protein
MVDALSGGYDYMSGIGRFFRGLLIFSIISGYVSALRVEDVPCSVIVGVWKAISTVGPSLIIVMFLYGAAKYAYGVEEPGARKQGRDICVHAVIGGVLMGLLVGIIHALKITEICAGLPT